MADRYATVRDDLERTGQVSGPFDLLIAATALVHDLTAITNNADEYRRIKGLRVENWQQG